MAIVRKKSQRDAVGKASEFHVRGRVIGIEDVHRYLKRKGISVEDAIARKAATPPDLHCCTPEAVPSSPSNPKIFEAPRQIFVSIRSYVLGSFESNIWLVADDKEVIINTKSSGTSIMDTFVNSLYTAYNLLEQRSFPQAGKFLDKGSALIHDLLLEDNPRMLVGLLDVMSLMLRSGWSECSNLILNHASNMAAIVLPDMHPLRRIFNNLILLGPELAEDIIANAWKSFLDVFEQTSGSSTVDFIQNWAEYIYIFIRLRDPDVVEGQLRSMVEKCKEVHGSLDCRYLAALLALADFLRVQRRYRDAAAAAKEVIHCASEGKFQFTAQARCRGMEVLARSQYGNFDDELAESTLRQAIATSSTEWGRQDANTLQLLTRLEQWLAVFGKLEEAKEVSMLLEEILKPVK